MWSVIYKNITPLLLITDLSFLLCYPGDGEQILSNAWRLVFPQCLTCFSRWRKLLPEYMQHSLPDFTLSNSPSLRWCVVGIWGPYSDGGGEHPHAGFQLKYLFPSVSVSVLLASVLTRLAADVRSPSWRSPWHPL